MEFKPGFLDELMKDPERLEAFKADTIRRALADNAALPPEQRRPEWAVIEYEQSCFDLFGI